MKAGSKPEQVDSFLVDLAEHVKQTGGEEMVRRSAFDTQSFWEFGRSSDADSNSEPVFCVARRGQNVFVAAPKSDNMIRLLGAAPKVTFAAEPNFREANDFFGSNKGGMYLYLDGPRLLDMKGNARRELKAIGMDQLRWIGVSMEPEGSCIRHRVEVRANVTSGFPTLFASKEQFDLAEYLPERAIACAQMAIDGPLTSNALRKLIAQAGPKAEVEFEQNMVQLRTRVGADFHEMLALLGNEVAVAVVPRVRLHPRLLPHRESQG